ncbi:MAG: hypothetical protein IJT79_04935 [Ruminococcus sp.]|nr:hypothetical protein [Ruminococcus sp.]
MKRNSSFFKVIAAIITFGGAIFGIVLGAVCKVDVSGIFESAKLRFNVGLMIQTWIISDIIALAFYWMSAVLSKLENIEKALGAGNDSETLLSDINNMVSSLKESASSQNSTKSASISNSIKTHSEKTSTQQNNIVKTNEWKCPNCGKIHQSYVGSCGCGEEKPKF